VMMMVMMMIVMILMIVMIVMGIAREMLSYSKKRTAVYRHTQKHTHTHINRHMHASTHTHTPIHIQTQSSALDADLVTIKRVLKQYNTGPIGIALQH
jgi:hypothetical protein